jgi:hypothetical protein
MSQLTASETVRSPDAMGLVVERSAAGVYRVTWHPWGGPADLFLLAETEHVDERCLQFADVLVAPVQPTSMAAVRLTTVLLRAFPGSWLVAATVDGVGYALGARGGGQVVVDRANRSATDLVGWAALGYVQVTMGGALRDIDRGARRSADLSRLRGAEHPQPAP